MRCRKCGQKAVINMRQHKLALCQVHYLEWIPEQVQRFIEKYKMFDHKDRVLVAVSGGKDSLSLWDILQRLGYQTEGLYIGLGIDDQLPDPHLTQQVNEQYSARSQALAEKYAAQHNLNLKVVNVQREYGETVPMLAERTNRGKEKPCSVCGLTKRHIMNSVAREGCFNVLVTGHNLDDEAAVLFSNTFNWLAGYLVRQAPVLEANRPGLVRKAKPLCRIYEREMAAYALLSGIEYIYDECPYSEGSTTLYYKEILNRMENDRPGAKLNFYLTFLQAKANGLFAPQADPDIALLHTCPGCSQPTSAPGYCTFCRMFSKKS